MWTSIVELSPARVMLTQLLGRVWRGAYFSSFAPLQVKNVPRPTLPGAGWVRVRNCLAGICGSDLHFIFADGDLRVAPAALPGHKTMYLGHEVVGEVIEKGDDVPSLAIGDRVVLEHGPNCLSSNVQPLCRSCASGYYGLCERGQLPEPHPVGGGWSEEMIVHEQQLFRVPTTLTDEQAVLLEPTSVALHAVLRYPPQDADRILIIGAGTIGLLTLQVVKALAPKAEVSVLARHGFQIEQATRMGATHIIYPDDSYEGVRRATEGTLYQGLLGNRMLLGGYDIIYDTVGTRRTLHDALRWVRAKGSILLIGVNLHMMNLDLTPLWYQEVNLLGTLSHGMEQWPIGSENERSTFSIAAEMMEQGQVQPEKLITHRFALDNYKHALRTAVDKGESRATKVVFDYALQPATVVPNVRASAAQRRSATKNRLTRPLDARPVSGEKKTVPIAEPVAELEEETIPALPVVQVSPTTPSAMKEAVIDLRRTSILEALPEDTESEKLETTTPMASVRDSIADMPTVPVPPDSAPSVVAVHEHEEGGPIVAQAVESEAIAAQEVPENTIDLAQLEQLLSDMPTNPIDFYLDFGTPALEAPAAVEEHTSEIPQAIEHDHEEQVVPTQELPPEVHEEHTVSISQYVLGNEEQGTQIQEEVEDADILALGPVQEALAELEAREERAQEDVAEAGVEEEIGDVEANSAQTFAGNGVEEGRTVTQGETKQRHETLLGVGSNGAAKGEQFQRRARNRKKK